MAIHVEYRRLDPLFGFGFRVVGMWLRVLGIGASGYWRLDPLGLEIRVHRFGLYCLSFEDRVVWLRGWYLWFMVWGFQVRAEGFWCDPLRILWKALRV